MTGDRQTSPILEFERLGASGDERQVAFLDATWVAPSELGELAPLGGTPDEPSDHVFTLHHYGAAAELRAGVASPGRIVLPEDVHLTAEGLVLHSLRTNPRPDPGCSHRLLLLAWAAQWLVAHAGVRTFSAVCHAHELHRYTPLGFHATSRWFASGCLPGGAVVIEADALEVLQAARSVGLEHVLESAEAAFDGRAALRRPAVAA
jgi:hypothetical protein